MEVGGGECLVEFPFDNSFEKFLFLLIFEKIKKKSPRVTFFHCYI